MQEMHVRIGAGDRQKLGDDKKGEKDFGDAQPRKRCSLLSKAPGLGNTKHSLDCDSNRSGPMG